MSEIAKPRHSGNILIVDDVEANRNVIRRRLTRLGYQIEEAASGRDALGIINRVRPDLILLDYMMPGMSGLEVVNVLRKEWKLTTLPIIMLTARIEADAQVSALQAGVDDYVTKPIDFAILDARIQTQLSKFQSENSLRVANESMGKKAALQALTLSEVEQELRREFRLRMELTSEAATLGKVSDCKRLEAALGLLQQAILAIDEGSPPSRSSLVAIYDILAGIKGSETM